MTAAEQIDPAAARGEAAYAHKPDWYFDGAKGARADFVAALRTGPDAAILEIGSGSGATGALALSEGKCGRYVGLEIAPEAAARAEGRITESHVGDVEAMDLPWPPESFDALIMSEVLEHLADPWGTLARLNPLLKPGAQVLVSSPNIAQMNVIRDLLRGRFDLTDSGVMDRTHLRWFTPATYAELVRGAGFELEEVRPLWRGPLNRRRNRLFNALTGHRFEHLFWGQIGVHAVKPAA